MGMSYSMSLENALIKSENYHKLIGWTPEEVAAESRADHAAGLALDAVNRYFSFGSDGAYLTDGGIDLSECGYWDSAGYGYGDELIELLRLCEPGAVLHDIDVEESTGAVTRYTVLADGSIHTGTPDVIWTDPEAPSLKELIAEVRRYVTRDRHGDVAMTHGRETGEAVMALLDALDGEVSA